MPTYVHPDEIAFKPYNSPTFENFVIPKDRLGTLIWDDTIQVRSRGEFEGIGMWLSNSYDYKIVKDSKGTLVLLAIKI